MTQSPLLDTQDLLYRIVSQLVSGYIIGHNIRYTSKPESIRRYRDFDHIAYECHQAIETYSADIAAKSSVQRRELIGKILDCIPNTQDISLRDRLELEYQVEEFCKAWHSGRYSPLNYKSGFYVSPTPATDVMVFDDDERSPVPEFRGSKSVPALPSAPNELFNQIVGQLLSGCIAGHKTTYNPDSNCNWVCEYTHIDHSEAEFYAGLTKYGPKIGNVSEVEEADLLNDILCPLAIVTQLSKQDQAKLQQQIKDFCLVYYSRSIPPRAEIASPASP